MSVRSRVPTPSVSTPLVTEPARLRSLREAYWVAGVSGLGLGPRIADLPKIIGTPIFVSHSRPATSMTGTTMLIKGIGQNGLVAAQPAVETPFGQDTRP